MAKYANVAKCMDEINEILEDPTFNREDVWCFIDILERNTVDIEADEK